MPLRFLDDAGYALGMIRDAPSWQLPKGSVYDALNLLFDKPGVARQRGGTTAIFSGAQTAYAGVTGWVYSNDLTRIEELYGFDPRSGVVSRVNNTTGALTTVETAVAASAWGRPARHFGFLVFPYQPSGDTLRSAVVLAGAVTSTTFTSTATASVTANDSTVTLSGADVTTNVRVGQVCFVGSAFGTNNSFWGRVTSIIDAKNFSVWPSIPYTEPAVVAGSVICGPTTTILPAGGPGLGGICATSWQNRLLVGNTYDFLGVNPYIAQERRIYYTHLPTEVYTQTGPVAAAYGAYYISGDYLGQYDFVETPGVDPIIGMEPVSDNELLILTTTRPVLLRGNLVTQLTTTSPQVTYDISDLDTTGGCGADFSIQRTPRGVMWAGTDGIFLYPGGGARPTNVLEGRMATYWRDLARSASFAIHGSAYIRGHYLVTGAAPTGTPWALLLNLATREPIFSRLSQVDIFNSVQRPSDPAQVWSLRWWAVGSAAPSMTNGQTIRLESMLDAYVTGATKTDSDGSGVPFSITTRVLAGDTDTQKIQQRATVLYQTNLLTGSITVTAQSKIDASDIVASSVRSLGNLTNTEARTLSNATNATPIVLTTTTNHGLAVGDYVDVNGVTGNLNANGRWRVGSVPSATTLQLLGSSGSAAYVSGGSVKKVTETDFQTNTLDQGQGVSFVITGATGVGNFELHGIRVGFLEQHPVMSA